MISLEMAGATGLEPATFGVTGRRSNQLSYAPTLLREYARAREIREPPGQVKRAATTSSPALDEVLARADRPAREACI
jgi:hypothetical protein